MSGDIVTKSVVSVTEMARMVGLSRARFYQLIRRGTFPGADQDPISQRPCYHEEKQRQIMEARRRNCGVDGKPIMFYSRRKDFGSIKVMPNPMPKKKVTSPNAGLIDSLTTLGLTVTTAQVDSAVNEIFPQGTTGIDPGEVIKAVFLRLRRQNPGDSVGR